MCIRDSNPTGALYPKETLEGIVEIARHHGLIIFADEIYDKVPVSYTHLDVYKRQV